MNAELIIQVRHEPGYVIATVAGEIDIATVGQLRQRLVMLAECGQPVIADLEQVSFMDAAGLGALVGASRRAAANGASLRVVCSRRETRRLFRLTGLDRQVPLAHTLAEALHALQGTRDGSDDEPPREPRNEAPRLPRRRALCYRSQRHSPRRHLQTG